MTAVDHDWPNILAAVIARPDDDLPRLIAADWLLDHGQPERAEFIRMQCELARAPRHHICGHDRGHKVCWICRLRRRERELESGHGYCWQLDISTVLVQRNVSSRFCRGFVESITLSAADWLTHHAALLKATPLRKVELTTPLDVSGVYETGRTFLAATPSPGQVSVSVAVPIDRPPRSDNLPSVSACCKARWPTVEVVTRPAQYTAHGFQSHSVGWSTDGPGTISASGLYTPGAAVPRGG